jgi:DNA modification methylase
VSKQQTPPPVRIGRHTVYHAEALATLRTMPPRSFNAVVADPPYCSAIRGGSQKQSSAKKYTTSDAARQFEEFLGDGRDQRSFLLWCTLWLSECWRVIDDGGAVLVFCDYRNLAAMIDAVQAGGLIFDGVVPWVKTNSRPRMGWFQTSRVEYVVVGRRGSTVSDARKLGPAALSGMAPQKRKHPTQKPVDTVAQLIAFRSDWARVLDPFGGLGTTAAACETLGRESVTIEQSGHYFEATCERLRDMIEPKPEAA